MVPLAQVERKEHANVASQSTSMALRAGCRKWRASWAELGMG